MKTLLLPEKAIYTGSLILVNVRHPYRAQPAEPALVPVRGDKPRLLLERRATVLLSRLMSDIDGWAQISPVSAWRSKGEQQELYARSLRENGAVFTARYVARPGHSEHQTGLAIDLGLTKSEIDFIRPDFPYRGICQTFRDKAAAYGFVERYPKGKEAVTGIAREPWHFRYVGVPHGTIMARLGLTLEEYHNLLKQYPYGKSCLIDRSAAQTIAVSYIEAAPKGDTRIEIDADSPYLISGNNVDGFVLTQWQTLGSPRQAEASRC